MEYQTTMLVVIFLVGIFDSAHSWCNKGKWCYCSNVLDFLLFKVESSAFALVCLEISNLLKLEISTLLKLENSCLLLFSEGLKFQALEGLKSNVKTDDSSYYVRSGSPANFQNPDCPETGRFPSCCAVGNCSV